ncbi:four helix bundle protein [Candidatus Omnitrophota bacterium]
MFRFEELDIWKLAIEYADKVYDLANKLPADEKYNLIIQLKKATLSISNNIAEGSGTATSRNFSSFLDISVASAFETINLLHFAKIRRYITEEEKQVLYQKAEILVKRIRAFKNSLK